MLMVFHILNEEETTMRNIIHAAKAALVAAGGRFVAALAVVRSARLARAARALLPALALAVSPVAAAQTRIIVVSHGQQNDPFWSIVKAGVDAAAADTGADVQYRAPATFDMPEMAKLIDSAVAAKPDGIVVSFPDASALGKAVQNAVRRGIPVISMNSGSDEYHKYGIAAHVGQTEYEAGLGGGRKMKAAGVTRALCVNHEVGNVALDLRCEGFAKGLEGEVEVVDTGGNDPVQVRTAVSGKLKADPSIDGVLTLGPLSAIPTLRVLEEGNMLGKIKLASFDLASETLKATRDGKMLFLIDQQPYLQGYLPVVMLVQNHKYAVIPAGVVGTGPGFVTPDNAAKVIDLSSKGFR